MIANQVSTKQPVETNFHFKYRKVEFKDRLLAYLIDTGGFWVFYFLLTIGLGAMFVLGRYTQPVAYIISYLTFLLRDGFNGGAGFGKGKRDTMVINTDNYEDCNYGRSVLRNIVSQISAYSLALQFGHAIPINLLFGIVTLVDVYRIIKTEDGRRVGDIIAHTQVVYIADRVQHKIELKKYLNLKPQSESNS